MRTSSSPMVQRVPGALSPAEIGAYVDAVARARAAWTSNFAGAQFTLGRAWYTHLEEDREEAYFAQAAASDAIVERCAPGLQDRVLALVAAMLGEPVARRPGWCGPGVHIFPAGSEVAERGGEIHYDTEGLSEEHIAARAPALSFVLMLQPPETGGGLRVWDRFYDGDAFPNAPAPSTPTLTVDYRAGELVAFDSYRLHQIMAFGGARDRVSATVHVVREDGRWEAWF